MYKHKKLYRRGKYPAYGIPAIISAISNKFKIDKDPGNVHKDHGL